MTTLNERQLNTLRCIYEVDQEQEQRQRRRSSGWWDNTPASIWRQIWYKHEPKTGNHSMLYKMLKKNRLVDPGLGSTFKALEERGFIKREYHNMVWDDVELAIKITRSGRKLIRSIENN